MPDAGFALQAAIQSRLAATAAVTGALGGARIYDHVPRGANFPYLAYGLAIQRDAGTGTEAGTEHIVTLHVWSKAAGRHEALAVLGAVRDALHDQPLALSGFRLVNLRHETSDVRRDTDAEGVHGTIRFRAVTEPSE